MKFFSKGKSGDSHAPSHQDEILDKVIYTLPNGKDVYTVRDMVAGLINFGQTGSGKTSGLCRQYFQSQLKFGMGGLALAVKQSFGRYVLSLADKTNRQVIHFKKGSPYSFNPLEYELNRQGEGAKEIGNITQLILMLSTMVNNYKAGGSGAKKSEPFWELAMERCLNRAISLLLLARLPVTIFNIRKIISMSFTEDEARRNKDIMSILNDENASEEKKNEVFSEYKDWVNNNFFLLAFHTANSREDLNEDELFSMELVGDYFLKEWPCLAEKTKSIVTESVMGVVEAFNYGILKDHFTEGVSEELLPENCYKNGTILLCDFPVREYKLAALMANGLMKYIFQTAWERRNIYEEENPQPVFLFIDEYASLCNPAYDPLFQSTARESLIATTLIVQSLNTLVGAMGSESPMNKARSLIGNLTMKAFNANDDAMTNSMAADMIGRHFIDLSSVSIDKDKNAHRSYSQTYHYQVAPECYTGLRTGGPLNKYKVGAVLFQAGRQWSTGDNYLQEEFSQLD